MKYYRNAMYIIPMDAGHRVILRMVLEVAKFKGPQTNV